MTFFQDWILKLGFVRKALAEAEREGGIKSFPLAQKDILTTFDDDYINPKVEKEVERRLINLLSIVDPRQIVSWDKARGIVYIGGERADENTLLNLKAEAEFFFQSNLWKLIQESPKKLAERAMFLEDGKLENQLIKGRAMLFTLDTQKTILEVFKSYEPK